MTRILWLGSLALALALTPLAPLTASAEVSLDVEVSPQTVRPGDTFSFSITVSGEGLSTLPEPHLPRLKKFEIVGRSTSQQYNIINFKTSITRTTTYQLRAPEDISEGEYEIPVVSLKVKDKTVRAGPTKITINNKAPAPRGPSRRGPMMNSPFSGFDNLFGRRPHQRVEGKEDLFVTMEVDHDWAYVYQPMIATFKLYSSTPLWKQPHYVEPKFEGFWHEQLTYPDGQKQRQNQEVVKGVRYKVVSVRYLLVPLSAGDKTIDNATIEIAPDPWRAGRTVATKKIRIRSLDPPEEGRPNDFTGMVGNYRVTITTDPPLNDERKIQLRRNQLLTLTVRLKGKGYLKAVPPPAKLNVEGFDLFDPKVTDSIDSSGDEIISERIIAYPLLPNRSGELVIPSLRHSWFDPVTGKYVIDRTDPIVVTVTPGSSGGGTQRAAQAAPAPGEGDIGYIRPDHTTLAPQGAPLYDKPLLWLLWFIPLPLLLTLFLRRRRRATDDPSVTRAADAYATALRSLAEINAGTPDFAGKMELAMRAYFGALWEKTPQSVDRALVRERLGDETLYDIIANLWSELEKIRYAPVGAEGAEDLLSRLHEALAKVEKRR